MNVLNKKQIDQKLFEIKNKKITALTNPLSILSLCLDFSGSMNGNQSLIKELLENIYNELSVIDKREFFLIIYVIDHSLSKLVYFDWFNNFNINDIEIPSTFIGRSPILKTLEVSSNLTQKVLDACDVSTQLMTIPIFIYITDSDSTEDLDITFLENLNDDIMNNKKIVIQSFANSQNVDLGGYSLNLTSPNIKKDIQKMISCLGRASSTSIDKEKGCFYFSKIPHPSNRKAYNKYLSDTLISNMKFYFSSLNNQ